MENNPKIKGTAWRQKHKRDLWLQILLPVLVIVLIGLVIGVLSAINGAKDPQTNAIWAGISLILLLLPYMLIGILLLIMIILTISLVSKAPAQITRHFSELNDLVLVLGHYARQVAAGSVKPIIRIKSNQAGVEKFFHILFRSFTKPQEKK